MVPIGRLARLTLLRSPLAITELEKQELEKQVRPRILTILATFSISAAMGQRSSTSSGSKWPPQPASCAA